MIDYEKLKLAHSLAYEYGKKSDQRLELAYKAIINSMNDSYSITLFNESACELHKFYCVDDLITKLEELIQPEPKYKAGDIVYLCGVVGKNIFKATIEGNELPGRYFVRFKDGDKGLYNEDSLYPTEEALIEARIAYWTEQLTEKTPQSDKDTALDNAIERFNADYDKIYPDTTEDKCKHPDKTRPCIFGWGWELRHCDKCDSEQWQENTAIGTSCLPPKKGTQPES